MVEKRDKEIDSDIIQDGFKVTENHYTGFWFCESKMCNEEGDYQFCFLNFEYMAKELCDLLNFLVEENKKLRIENKAQSDALDKLKTSLIEGQDAYEVINSLVDIYRECHENDEEHHRTKFKLDTLEKWYVCGGHCAFNRSEFKYLGELDEQRKKRK